MGRKGSSSKKKSVAPNVNKVSQSVVVEDDVFIDMGEDHKDVFAIGDAGSDNEACVDYEGELNATLEEMSSERAKTKKLTRELQVAKDLCNTLKGQVKKVESSLPSTDKEVESLQSRLTVALKEKKEFEEAYQSMCVDKAETYKFFSGMVLKEQKLKEAALKEIEDLQAKLEATIASIRCVVNHEAEESVRLGMATTIDSLKFQTTILEQNAVEHKKKIEMLTDQLQQQATVKGELDELKAKNESLQERVKGLVDLLEAASAELQTHLDTGATNEALRKKVKELECLCQYSLNEKQEATKKMRESAKELEAANQKLKVLEKLEASTKKLDCLSETSHLSNGKLGSDYMCEESTSYQGKGKAPVEFPVAKSTKSNGGIKGAKKHLGCDGGEAPSTSKNIKDAPSKLKAKNQRKGYSPSQRRNVRPHPSKVSNFQRSNQIYRFDGYCYNCDKYGHRIAYCTSRAPFGVLLKSNSFGALAYEKDCYHCGAWGHIAAHCPNWYRTTPPPKSYYPPGSKMMICYLCGNVGHVSSKCPKRLHGAADLRNGYRRRVEVTCYGCGEYGHIVRDCPYEIRVVPPRDLQREKGRRRQNVQSSSHVTQRCNKGDLNALILRKIQEHFEKSTRKPQVSKQKKSRQVRNDKLAQESKFAWKLKECTSMEATSAYAKVDSQKTKNAFWVERKREATREKNAKGGLMGKKAMADHTSLKVRKAKRVQNRHGDEKKKNGVTLKDVPLRCFKCTKTGHFASKGPNDKRGASMAKKVDGTSQSPCSNVKLTRKSEMKKSGQVKRIIPKASIDYLRTKLSVGEPTLF